MPHALIIDDNNDDVGILYALLREEGLTSTIVYHPADLPDILPTLDEVDIIFLDFSMPALDGYEVFDLLQEYSHLQGIPVVAYTVMSNLRASLREVGLSGFLSKPIDADRFPDYLRRLLNHQQVW